MFKVKRINEGRIDVIYSGKLDSDAMKAGLDEMISASEGIEHGRMMIHVGDFEMPTLGAMGVEMSRLPHLFRFIRRFDRAAVIAGQAWIRKASEVEGTMIPGLTIKAFDLHEAEPAEQWLDGSGPA